MKRKLAVAIVLMMGIATMVPAIASAQWGSDKLVIMDFNSGDKPSNIGGDFGVWNKDPNDTTQSCEMGFIYGDDALGNPDGYSLRLTYDVDSPNPAYNGFWAKLEGEDFSDYDTLNIYIKGDASKGFTKKVKIELKDFQKSASYIISGITDSWQKFSIPFEKFRAIKDWSSMNELVVVFDDINTDPKVGSILIDQISVSKEGK